MRTLLAAAVAAMLGGAAQGHAAVPCPPVSTDGGEPLPLLAPLLKPKGQLDVLVVGSASSEPKGGEPKESTIGQMSRALEASIPGLHVTLTFAGKRFMAAPDLVPLMSDALGQHRYGLVIWQTGTADAVRSEPAGDFYQALSDGAAAAAAHGTAMVLVDPQYSRFLQTNADIEPYLGAMRAIASTAGVLLFDRFAIMQEWSDSGAIDLEQAAPGTRPAVAARLHACLGQQLAQTLVASVAAPP